MTLAAHGNDATRAAKAWRDKRLPKGPFKKVHIGRSGIPGVSSFLDDNKGCGEPILRWTGTRCRDKGWPVGRGVKAYVTRSTQAEAARALAASYDWVRYEWVQDDTLTMKQAIRIK
jgi:hypothetical protein